MSDNSDDDLPADRRPQKKSQGRTGRMGNPKRKRPTGAHGTVEIIDRLFQRPMEIKINGETKLSNRGRP